MNSQLSATSRSQIRNRMVKLAGENIRNYPQPTGSEFANARIYPLAVKKPDDQFLQSSDNDPINSGNHPTDFTNPSIMHRRIGLTHRPGCGKQGLESSDNRQMICGNRKIGTFFQRPSSQPNRKVIVNRFAVIVNSAARNLSPIHHQNTELYHRAGRPPAIRLLEASDNHPTKRRNHPTDSANLPIINRQIFAIYRSFHTNKLRAQLRKHAPLPPVALPNASCLFYIYGLGSSPLKMTSIRNQTVVT